MIYAHGAQLIGIVLVLAVAMLGSGCNSKREEPVLLKVKEAEVRSTDYRKSYYFDQKVAELIKGIQQWDQMLSQLIENHSSGEKQPLLVNSIEFVLPILKEAQRGFFKKVGSNWQKDVAKFEALSTEKDLYLEKISILLSDDSSWMLTASGRYPKDQVGELFVLKWNFTASEFRVESKQSKENKFSCLFTLKPSGDMETVTCDNFMVFRMENKDITIDHLTYDSKKGFNGQGKVTQAKGQTEKWEIHSPIVTTIVAPIVSEN